MSDYITLPPLRPRALPNGCWQWQTHTHVTQADQAVSDYLLVPFEVPPGLDGLSIDCQVSQGAQAALDNGTRNVIDLGLWDPRGVGFRDSGFRGWSGSERTSVTVGPAEVTTPGYVPGPIQPGLWHVVLGLYRIRDGGCGIEIQVEGRSAAAEEPVVATNDIAGPASMPLAGRPQDGQGFLLPSLQGVLRARPGWYRGDLHTHTRHSDGLASVQELAAIARRRGLDFVAVTDHNTHTSWPYLAEAGGADLLLIPAEEITTYYGHANVWASSRWHDFRLRTPAAMAQVAAEAHAVGAPFSINHPCAPGAPWLLGTDLAFDFVEVWNGHWSQANKEALAWWDKLLQQGRRVIAVGGSDRHEGKTGGDQATLQVGQPTTWIYGRELSIAGLLAGLRDGQVCISADPQGPRLDVAVITADGQRAAMGQQIALAGRPARVQVHVQGAAGQHLRVLRDGQSWQWQPIADNDELLSWPLTGPTSYVRAQVEASPARRDETLGADHQMLAVSNPVWITQTALGMVQN